MAGPASPLDIPLHAHLGIMAQRRRRLLRQRTRHAAEKIVAKLRQVDVLMAQGRQVADAVRAKGVTEVTYYRWRNEHGGLGDQVKRLKELETENTRLRRAVSGSDAGQADPGRGAKGKLSLAPPRCVDRVTTELGISEGRACRTLGQHRSTQRKTPTTPDDEAALTADIIELTRHPYGPTKFAKSANFTGGDNPVNSKERLVSASRLDRLPLKDGAAARYLRVAGKKDGLPPFLHLGLSWPNEAKVP